MTYKLWIDGVLTSELPAAPPITKENIPVVCQSDTLVYRGEVTIRYTFQVFIEGIMSQIVADHNKMSLCTYVEVDGKVIKQWDGMTLEEFAC